MTLEDKVALVTGAAGGIGESTARTLASRGAKVVVADYNAAAGESVTEAIRAAGGEAVFCRVDVTDAADVDALVKFVVETYGRLDLAHNNAGVLHEAEAFQDLSLSSWERTLDVNLRGVIHCLRAEIRQMLAQGSGAIVNTASGAGFGAAPGLSAYVASKHGVVGVTRAAAVELAPRGIRVNAVAPGTVETGMTATMTDEQRDELNKLMPMGRMARPQEVADVVAFLLSDEASYVNGSIVTIDGGASARA